MFLCYPLKQLPRIQCTFAQEYVQSTATTGTKLEYNIAITSSYKLGEVA